MPKVNYDGTTGSSWKLGSGGPQLKDSSGTIKARNAGDSADAPITASLGTFSTGVTVTGNATDADPLLDAQANVGTTTSKTSRLGMVRTGGLALDETGMCCKMELLTHASDVAGSSVVGLVVGMSNAQAGNADKIGILIQNETGVASFTTGIQLGDDITLEWGNDSEGNFRFLDASQTIVLENDSATGKIRCELGTATSATDFRVTDSTSAQLFTVNGAGLATSKGRALAVRSTAVTTTAGTADDVIVFTASGQTLNLPAIATANQRYHVSLRVAGTLTIDAFGAETINGLATKVLSSQYESVILIPVSTTDWGIF